jgi:hypothetical protein
MKQQLKQPAKQLAKVAEQRQETGAFTERISPSSATSRSSSKCQNVWAELADGLHEQLLL